MSHYLEIVGNRYGPLVAIKRFDIYSIAEITTLGLPRDRDASCYSILPCLRIQDF